MALDLATLLVILLAGFFGGIIDSSVGGGGLIRIPVLLAAGMPPHMALGTNKVGATGASTISAIQFWKTPFVNKRLALKGLPFSVVGSLLGVFLVLLLPATSLRLIVISVLVIVFLYTLFTPKFGTLDKPLPAGTRHVVTFCLIAFLLGGYDGFFGPGTGSFLIMSITMLLGYGITRAAAMGRILNWGSNLAAATYFGLAGQVVWVIGIPLAAANVLGGWVGTWIVLKHGVKVLRPLFILVTGAMIVKLALDLAKAA